MARQTFAIVYGSFCANCGRLRDKVAYAVDGVKGLRDRNQSLR